VQTIIYTLLAIWACAEKHKTYEWSSLANFAKRVRVFGDDIIVPTDVYPVLTSLLTTCQLKVNTSKSFDHGKFRESCGMDAYDGIDVTPAYVRQLPGAAASSLVSIVKCSNNFHMKGMWHTAAAILKTVPYEEVPKLLITTKDSGAFGLISFCGEATSHLKKRWNEALHRNEVQCLSVQYRVERKRGRGHGDLLQYFHEVPSHPSCEKPTLHELLGYLDPHDYEGGEVVRANGRKSLVWVVPLA
jgi:hypothetical protein